MSQRTPKNKKYLQHCKAFVLLILKIKRCNFGFTCHRTRKTALTKTCDKARKKPQLEAAACLTILYCIFIFVYQSAILHFYFFSYPAEGCIGNAKISGYTF